MIAWLLKNPVLSGALALCLALAAALTVSRMQLSSARVDAANARTDLANLRADIAEKRETFERLTRATEQRQATEMAAVAAANEQRIANVEREATRTADDLRTGVLRLRQHWDAYRATADLSGAAASAAQPDGAADLRRAGAVDLVRIADAADARIIALQSAIRVMQGAGQ